MKRIVLFIATNLAVVFVLSIILKLFGLDRTLSESGIQYGSLIVFSLVLGFGGAIISLLISKRMAKWTTGARVIEQPQSEAEVLGHEISHVANGDMVTLTLIQGVVNTFVIFASRVVGSIVDKTVFRTERGTGPGYFITVLVCQFVFGILASLIVAWFSRQREFRADAGSAKLLGTPRPMVNALARLGGLEPGQLPQSLAAAGITGGGGLQALFASHPPIEVRIAALQSGR